MDPISPNQEESPISTPLRTRIVTPITRDEAFEKQRALEAYEASLIEDQALDTVLKKAELERQEFDQKLAQVNASNETIESKNQSKRVWKKRLWLTALGFIAIGAVCAVLNLTVMAGW